MFLIMVSTIPALGVEKTSEHFIDTIQFQTNPKCDLTHYSFIFRNNNTFGTWLNNGTRSNLDTM